MAAEEKRLRLSRCGAKVKERERERERERREEQRDIRSLQATYIAQKKIYEQ